MRLNRRYASRTYPPWTSRNWHSEASLRNAVGCFAQWAMISPLRLAQERCLHNNPESLRLIQRRVDWEAY
jgi:hypothetical protein